MATANKIHVVLSDIGVFHVDGISLESTAKASELLQLNHDQYHIYFNKIGLHNHLAHHMLTLVASGASPERLQSLFDQNTAYQRRMEPPDNKVVKEMQDPTKFKKHVADGENYFLASETAAQASTSSSKGLVTIVNEIRADATLRGSARWADREKLVDGVLARAEKELIKYGSEWKVSESELGRKTAEMINAGFVFTFGA
ncbi:hypothetical protein AK830_g1674 [Neonectria ditissima]|uniref:Uncharacterized protein n=1 Tax=Neonectria ditissima TaxID=78410 RepID=A0A0P7BI08_9HYPO|nr:hypothetical protein AK830_g1674 [Neonectria ditissima]